MIDGVHWKEEERREEGVRERRYSCQDDLSLPSTDPDAALFPQQLNVCVCTFFPSTPNRDLAFSDSSELRGNCEADNQLLPQQGPHCAL